MFTRGDSPLGKPALVRQLRLLGDYSDMQRRDDDAWISGSGGGVRCKKRQGDELILLGLCLGSIWACKWKQMLYSYSAPLPGHLNCLASVNPLWNVLS